MPGSVAVVTDSTSYLPDGIADRLSIGVVPLQVTMGERTALEGVDVTAAEFAEWLSHPGRRATTSQPSPAAFAEVYGEAVDRGATDIVSIHISGGLSGTADAARVAGQQVPDAEVHVIDSRHTGMALGFAVIAAAEAAAAGAAASDVVAAAERAAARTQMLFYVDTLEHLRRGGRIGRAGALLGAALSVKPLLHVADGVIAPLEKVRTASKAIARLSELVIADAGADEVDIAIHDFANSSRADVVEEQLRRGLANLRLLYRTDVGPVVGAHAGPGMLGVVVCRR